MSNKRVYVKALLRGYWVIMAGDKVKPALGGGGLLPGERAKVLRTYYVETPILDSDKVSREAWVDIEIIRASNKHSIGIQMQEPVQSVVPAGYEVGGGPGSGGRSFDQFVEEYVALSLTVATYERSKVG